MTITNNSTETEKTAPQNRTRRFNFVPIILGLMITSYIVAIMGLHWLRHERFMNGFDLAFYEQAAWNTAHGRFLEVSATDFSRSLLGTDVLLIVALMTPLYLLVQSPFTLLFQETLVVGLGALPVYWITRDRLGSRIAGLLFAATYLMLLGVQNGNLYELRFRPMAMGFLLFAFYFYERGKFWPFGLFAVLALCCRPENGMVLVMLALYGFISGRHRSGGWRFVVGPLVLGAVWFAVAVLLIIPGVSTTSGIALSENFAGGSPLQAVIVLFTDPAKFFPGNALAGKLLYIPLLLLPLLFLPLGSPKVLLMALPSLGLNLLSSRPIQWNAYDHHYQGSIIPWLLVATIYTIEKLSNGGALSHRQVKSNGGALSHRLRNKVGLAGAVLIATLAVYLVFNVVGVEAEDIVRTPNRPARVLTLKTQPRWEAGTELLKLIPDDAPLAITNLWASHVKARQGLWFFRENKTLYSVHPTREAQYVFADRRDKEDQKLLDSLPTTEWNLLKEDQGYVVLKRK